MEAERGRETSSTKVAGGDCKRKEERGGSRKKVGGQHACKSVPLNGQRWSSWDYFLPFMDSFFFFC